MKDSAFIPRKVKIGKFIWWIPHYRVPVFRRLSQNPHLDFTLYAGNNPHVWRGARVASASDVGNIEGVNWHIVKSVRLKGPLFRDYEWQQESVKAVLKEKFDAVICFGNKSLSNWLIRVICKLRGIPVIEWTIGVMGPENWLKWSIRKFYMKWSKAHLLYGNTSRDWYVSHGFKEEEVFVVHNSLDHDSQVSIRESITPADIKHTRETFGITTSEGRLLFHSGRLEKKKNISLLLDALQQLKHRNRNIKLVLIGEGREEKNLRDHAKYNGIEDMVIFYGPCYKEAELGKIISASDLCVVPGVTGLIAMHSLVYGTPILTRDNRAYLHGPEVEAVIEGETGGYFQDGNLCDLVEKMESMLYPIPCKSRMSHSCTKMIDTYYTPKYQEEIIVKALNFVLPPEKQIPL